MATDEVLAGKVRAALAKRRAPRCEEKRVTGGGLGFVVDGKLLLGVVGDDLMVRLEGAAYEDAKKAPGVRPLTFGGRATKAYLLVERAALGGAKLRRWIDAALAPASAAGDPRVDALLAAMSKRAALRPIARAYEVERAIPGRKFGKNALKVAGKLVALFTQGTLVVKLTKARVDELVAAKLGKPFDPGHGRLMKEWLAVTSTKASWIELVSEAVATASSPAASPRSDNRPSPRAPRPRAG